MILPTFYERPPEFARVMRSGVAFNGLFFNTQRMLAQYVQNTYSIPDSSVEKIYRLPILRKNGP